MAKTAGKMSMSSKGTAPIAVEKTERRYFWSKERSGLTGEMRRLYRDEILSTATSSRYPLSLY
ncbi:hypothetical protein E5D57_008156 [Metarhizium anisopliae]|nr:hypothetical protein E5D57_008156 [Metarhizium anisopliae]